MITTLRTRFTSCLSVLALALVSSCSALKANSPEAETAPSPTPAGNSSQLIVLEVGHCSVSGGAQTPSAVDGRRINEYDFWYQYSYYAKQEIEKAGYQCIVINRGNAPTKASLKPWVAKGHVLSLGHPDNYKEGRYASKHSPDRIGLGMISADYALEQNPACVIFLHHNSYGSGWKTGAAPSIMMTNKYNGADLGQVFCDYFNKHIFNQAGGIDNGGKGAVISPRSKFALGGAGWLNVLDDAGIPAAVVEMGFLNNRNHVAYLSQDAKAIEYAQAVGRSAVLYMNTKYKDCPHHKRANKNVPDEGTATHNKLQR